MSLKVFRKWLSVFMLTVCLFLLAACNESSSNGGGGGGGCGGDVLAVYTALNASDYTNPGNKLGVIRGNGDLNSYCVAARVDTIPPLTVAYQEAKVFAFGNRPKDGSATVVLERYYYDLSVPANNVSTFTTFDASGEINETTIASNTKDWGLKTGSDFAVNTYNTVRMGDYIYMLSHDVGRISKINLATGSLVSSVVMSGVATGYTAKGQDIIVTNGKIFALFYVTDEAYPATYQNSIVVEVKHTDDNSAPTFGDQVTVGKNAQSLAPVDNYIYVPSIGGDQGYGTGNGVNSRIDRITLSESSMTVDTNPVYYVDNGDNYDFHGLVIGKEKTLIFRVMGDAAYKQFAYLTHINTADLHTARNAAVSTIPANHLLEQEELTGAVQLLLYDDVYDHFWVAADGKLTIHNKDLSDQKDLSMENELYGIAEGAINSIALLSGELSSSGTTSSRYVSRAVRSGLFSTPEEYYKSLK
jgi:hypothetical protein